jgi:ribosome-binding factor A
MRKPSHRPERVSELIRKIVAEFLTGDVRDPRIGFVTVTGVEASPDLTHAKVRVSVMGTDEERDKSLEGLASAARFLRAQLAKELTLRVTPELHFELDRGLEHAQHIDRVLKQLKGDGGGGES